MNFSTDQPAFKLCADCGLVPTIGCMKRCLSCRTIEIRRKARIYTAAWRRKYPDRFEASRRRWDEKNPEKRRQIWQRQAHRRLIARRAVAAPSIRAQRERAEVAAVYALVPVGVVGRDDIVQMMLLHLYEGRTTIEQLKAGTIRQYVGGFWRENHEQRGYARSLDEPLAGGGTLLDTRIRGLH